MDKTINTDNIKIILATDCGSTTTKAILIQHLDGVYRLTHRGEAPTTVEAPFEDVTRGVLNAIMELEELSGRTILNGEEIILEENDRIAAFVNSVCRGTTETFLSSGFPFRDRFVR